MPETFSRPLDPLPVGAIKQFHGDPSEIPRGWVLCDGNNGTPNLLDKFVRSVPDGSTDPGATGGSKSITLSTQQLPDHNHPVDLTSVGDHDHEWEVNDEGNDGNQLVQFFNNVTPQTSTNGSHSHSSVALSNTGNGDSIDNQPNHTELLFIKKI
jgi:microcystin-dependent protein